MSNDERMRAKLLGIASDLDDARCLIANAHVALRELAERPRVLAPAQCFVPGCHVGGRGSATFHGKILPCCRAHLGSDRAHREAIKICRTTGGAVTWTYPDGESTTNVRGDQ